MLFESMIIPTLSAALPVPSPSGGVGPTDLIPREVLFGNPERAAVRISPDGSMLAYLAPFEGILNVWVQPTTGGDARPLTQFRDRPITGLQWAWNGEQLLLTKDQGGDENYHVYTVDLSGVEIRDLTPIDGVQASIHSDSPQHADEIVVAMNDTNPQFMNLYRINTRTGSRSLIHENDGYLGQLLDSDWNVRVRFRMNEEGAVISEIRDATGQSWQHFLTIPPQETITTHIGEFSRDGTRIYGVSSLGRDKAALVWWEPRPNGGQDPHILFESTEADVADDIHNVDTHAPEAAMVNRLRPQWHVLDEAVAKDIEGLAKLDHGDFTLASRTQDNQTWVVAYTRDNGSPRFWIWNRDTGQGTFLFSSWPDLDDKPLTSMQPLEITARDGLKLPSYLTLPNRSSGSDLPLVLLVHGGPWARDHWGYHPIHQWLSNRGYAVLSTNFRGSTGFGKAFVNAGDRQWYKAMQDDLNDAVAWAIDQGIADPKRIAIMGGSYGGYATLAGLTRDPELFAAGVDIVGPSHVGTLLASVPPYWKPMLKTFENRVGAMGDSEHLDAISPLTHVQNIQSPLLIGQGANDPRVKVSESDQIVEAMNSNGLPVTYVVFPDEGHGFYDPKNNLAFNAIVEHFLAKHIGGRAEPIGDEIHESSAQVRDKGGLELAGVEVHVPELGETNSAARP